MPDKFHVLDSKCINDDKMTSEIALEPVQPPHEPQKLCVQYPPLIYNEPSSVSNVEIQGDDIFAPSIPRSPLLQLLIQKDGLSKQNEVEAKLAGSPHLLCSANLQEIGKDDESPGSSTPSNQLIQSPQCKSCSSEQQSKEAEVKSALPHETRYQGIIKDGAPSSLVLAVQEPETRPLARPSRTKTTPPIRIQHQHGYGDRSSGQILGHGHRPPHHWGGGLRHKVHPVPVQSRPPVTFPIHWPPFHGGHQEAHALTTHDHVFSAPDLFLPLQVADHNRHPTAMLNYDVYVVPGYSAPSGHPTATFHPAGNPYFSSTYIPTGHTASYQYPPLPPPPPPTTHLPYPYQRQYIPTNKVLNPNAVPYPAPPSPGPSNSQPTRVNLTLRDNKNSEDELLKSLGRQIEYYFSDQNLEIDDYLKGLMDLNGFVNILSVARFYKAEKLVKRIARSRGALKGHHPKELEIMSIIKEALSESTEIEIVGEKLRKRNGWEKYCSINN